MKKLILVEGLPGTGKTTVTQWLGDRLAAKGEKVTLLFEGDERIPMDFYMLAGVPREAFEELSYQYGRFPEGEGAIILRTENYVFVRIDRSPAPWTEALARWDMGDEDNTRVDVPAYMACALERLDSWVKHNAGGDEIAIMDSGFLQNPINELLFRDAADAQVTDFIRAIAAQYAKMDAACVYLKRQSAGEALDFAARAKGPEWAQRVEGLLEGADCPDLFVRRFRLELSLLGSLPHLVCPVEGDDWTEARALMEGYFGL